MTRSALRPTPPNRPRPVAHVARARSRLRPLGLWLALCAGLAAPGLAAAAGSCGGQDLMAGLAPAQSAALDAAIAGQPFAEGNRWHARKGAAEITLVGTMHVDDPRLDAPLARLMPVLAQADGLWLEATDEDMAALQQDMARDPSLMFLNEGPSLLERMGPDWPRLRAEMEARGMPALIAARLQPWYVSMVIGLPPCAMQAAGDSKGLDGRLMAAARTAGVPMHALEPRDTVFRLFDAFPVDTQVEMIRAALPMAEQSEDQFATLLAAYFAESHLRLWAFSRQAALAAVPDADRAEAERDYALFEDAILTRRNAAWVERLTEATGDGSRAQHLVAAFGAAHLAGPEGVLAGLAARGWQLAREPF
ncbi:TraB/GumN family protein [Frigidibacter sp. MR17.14]|uniref:TraB/GumN family protein n=1 Tax=Frigidibacter sp. MR17.14 TaxID=3126509 RepID=UPI0030131B4D